VIVEIGPAPYVALAYPDETLFFATDKSAAPPPGVRTLPSLAALSSALGSAELKLVVCRPNFSTPWGPRHLGRQLFSRRLTQGRASLLSALGPELLRGRISAPVVVLDHEDLPVINRDNLFLLDRCALWFKRELPADRWRVFLKTAHRNLPTPRFREDCRRVAWVEKLRPISIGLPTEGAALLPIPPAEKRFDVFFAGRVTGSSTLRPRGLAELRALAGAGHISLDIPAAPLPRPDFYRRCAAARLVWSPEGLGWDCFRHYEAAACGSVPLINHPPLERHAPLLAGEHALYYDAEPGGLTRAVVTALADGDALGRIAAAGQTHVMAHHTPTALARHVVQSAASSAPHLPRSAARRRGGAAISP
jgi:hypothetical protein